MHLSLLALGVGPGDEVITTPITWPATANVIVHTGATPVFADVRESDLNIDPSTSRALVGPRTKAILPVHLAGQPADLDPLWALGLPVVEDAAHAVESEYRGPQDRRTVRRHLLLALRDEERRRGGRRDHHDRPRRRRSRDRRSPRHAARHGSLYDIAVPGYKANLSDVLAAIALCQLDKLERHREIRLRHVAAYDEAVAALDGHRAARPRSARLARAPPLRRPRRPRAGRRDARRVPARAGRGADRYEHPLPPGAPAERVPRALFPSSRRCRSPSGRDEVLSLPLSPAHSDDDIADAIDALRAVHARSSVTRDEQRRSARSSRRSSSRRSDRLHRLEDRPRRRRSRSSRTRTTGTSRPPWRS